MNINGVHMDQSAQTKFRLRYQLTIDIWEKFCILHKELFDLTCQEYLTLLEGEIETLEKITPQKEILISEINQLEKSRGILIQEINEEASSENKIAKASELITYFFSIESEKDIFALRNLNNLLIDIIQRLQEQNKKNQLFLNKAIISIKDLKDSFRGKKVYTTYGSDGLTKTINR